MWQALETKAQFISQIITGDNAARRAEDIGSQELSYAEVKAIASGNPAVLTLAEADAELQRLTILKKNHCDEQYIARQSLRTLPLSIHHLSERVKGLTKDMAMTARHNEGSIIINNVPCVPDKVIAVLGGQLDGLPGNVLQQRTFPLGKYRGLGFGVVLHPQFPPEVYLEGAVTRQTRLSRESHGPRAVLNALERLVEGYASELGRTQQDLTVAENQLRDYQGRLGTKFAHEAYLTELTAIRDQLKLSLSGGSSEAKESLPTASELADRIKKLKAAHTIDGCRSEPANALFPPKNPSPRRLNAGQILTQNRQSYLSRATMPTVPEWPVKQQV